LRFDPTHGATCAGEVRYHFGDGRGLKAAMTVSAIMGASRGFSSNRPTEILAHLNRMLFGPIGGFVTCSVAIIEADGAMALANAGSPAPFAMAKRWWSSQVCRWGCWARLPTMRADIS
jgi:hypothetical protein